MLRDETPARSAGELVRGPYEGHEVVFGTQHGKQQQASAPFARILGAYVVAPGERGIAIDTDRFGTFSGERPRTLSPQEAAEAKAALAISVTGIGAALASEGSYGPRPELGWPGHEELLLFVDRDRGLRVVERQITLGTPGHVWTVEEGGEIPLEPLRRHGWPSQAVLVRAQHGPVLAKGVADEVRLRAAVQAARALSPNRTALIEPDLRAHRNPSRRAVIARLAERMAERLATPCPDCHAPGYGQLARTPGLPCRWCRWPTRLTLSITLGCAGCPRRDDVPADELADPGQCPRCNP